MTRARRSRRRRLQRRLGRLARRFRLGTTPWWWLSRLAVAAVIAWLLAQVPGAPGWRDAVPRQVDDACDLFEEKPHWYRPARKAAERWQVDEGLLLAVIAAESGFRPEAAPRRKLLWGVVPLRRASSATGYAQALEGTWGEYEQAVGGRRQPWKFAHAVDFTGWYLDRNARDLGLSREDGKALYLAYHEGPRGYRRGRWQQKRRLVALAERVEATAQRYARQLDACREDLESRHELWMALGVLAVTGCGLIWLIRRRG